MVQVIKRTKVKGKVYESPMVFSDSEWKMIQKHYPNGVGNATFHLTDSKGDDVKEIIAEKVSKPGREKDDDKPKMKDYEELKDKAVAHFRKEEWEKAKYYFEEARKLKNHGWLSGKINTCIKNLEGK